MKKGLLFIISFVISCTLFIISCDVSYADKITTYSKVVRGKVVDKATSPPVYSVDVSWGAMNFTYSTRVTPIWNETSHVYDETYTSEWIAEGNTIKLTNHSNVDIKAKFKYVILSKYNNINGKFSDSQVLRLPSAVDKGINAKELTGTRDLILSGKLNGEKNEFTRVGSIKIEID